MPQQLAQAVGRYEGMNYVLFVLLKFMPVERWMQFFLKSAFADDKLVYTSIAVVVCRYLVFKERKN